MINAVTVTMDLQTLDPELPGKLMLMQPLTPGSARTVPGGVMVFQAACLNSEAGEPSGSGRGATSGVIDAPHRRGGRLSRVPPRLLRRLLG